ncbi:MAG: hypothetical protein R8J85_03945 [Mariprofundales bacterium]
MSELPEGIENISEDDYKRVTGLSLAPEGRGVAAPGKRRKPRDLTGREIAFVLICAVLLLYYFLA